MSELAPRILIIDNDEGVQLAIATRLRAMGYTCATAASGSAGLYEFRSQPFDLVISDLNMPAGDGIELAKAMREVTDIPIIFVTGYAEEFRRDLRQIADVSVLEKPFDTDTLLDLVEAELTTHGCTLP